MNEFERAAEVIASAPSLALACHEMPDGDALGSMLAMTGLALSHGKEVVASWPEPFIVAPQAQFVTMRGGEYLFVPSLTALAAIADGVAG